MKSALFFIYFVTLYNFTFAQGPDLVFIGAVTVKGGAVYNYTLHVNDSAGILKGYSVTDIMGADETKTAVTGTIDAAKKQFIFRETRLIYSKSKAGKSDLCYIHARLKISATNGATTLKGSFDGFKEDGKTSCATGKLTLVNAQNVLDKLLEIAKDENIPNPDSIAKPETVYTYETEIADSKTLKALPGKPTELYCSSPTINVELWDAKTIDGDIITLQQDNNTVLENYTLTAQHKQLTLSIGDKKTTTLSLIAVSEGSEPMNTARIKIISGDAIYYIDATTTIGKNVTVVLKR